jgi:hypothetical protein
MTYRLFEAADYLRPYPAFGPIATTTTRCGSGQ